MTEDEKAIREFDRQMKEQREFLRGLDERKRQHGTKN
jgi:hypothetical protein